jgi:S-methylmethionine-dependent homocysteine/selenocysteine methylase
MSKYRRALPQLKDRLFVTDGGLETTLVFHEGVDLPHFAAFDLLKDEAGTQRLREYFIRYIEIARRHALGVVLEAPTWRANADWGARLGYDAPALADANRRAIGLLLELRAVHETPASKIVVSGNLGPRGDGYRPDLRMSVDEAQAYHTPQLATFATTDADMVAAFTMTTVEEAAGIVRAAKALLLPVAISFTLETDGRLPSGASLAQAIESTDALTDGYPVYYLINCAHPSHFAGVLAQGGAWRERVRGLRANASRRSHAELDQSTDLDAGNPDELGGDYRALRPLLPRLSVVGGCCGTDHRHVGAICRALLAGAGAVAEAISDTTAQATDADQQPEAPTKAAA